MFTRFFSFSAAGGENINVAAPAAGFSPHHMNLLHLLGSGLIDFTGRSEELLVILISANRDRLEIRDRTEIDPRSTPDRWPNLVELPPNLLVGRRDSFDPPTVAAM